METDYLSNKEKNNNNNDKIDGVVKSINNININNTTNDICVIKWVDYTSKYGLGYLLNNGHCGVFFNDSTKVILDPKTSIFSYIEKKGQERQEIIITHTLNDYPIDLQKKVTLLQHFKGYLNGENNNKDNAQKSDGINTNNNINNINNKIEIPDENTLESLKKSSNFVYVKKWMKTRHAIMFRLSNKIVQVCFQDHTEIILSSESRIVTYVNKKRERSIYPLNTALESNNNEMTKRLKYTKDILTHMLNINQPLSNQIKGKENVNINENNEQINH
jgi:polo-like kinase 1